MTTQFALERARGARTGEQQCPPSFHKEVRGGRFALVPFLGAKSKVTQHSDMETTSTNVIKAVGVLNAAGT